MKKACLFTSALALALYGALAFAQHGHAGTGGMGPSSRANSNSPGMAGTNTSAVRGKAMDQVLTQNKKLSDRIATLTGQQAQQACAGFRNLGQCVAAAHVSKNLGISFDCLKNRMTGIASGCSTGTASTKTGTGTTTMSLGKSIQTLSPASNSKAEAKKGQQQATQDLKDSGSTS